MSDGDGIIQRENGERMLALDMTEERKQMFRQAAEDVMQLLKPRMLPVEAYAVLFMLVKSMEEQYDFMGALFMEPSTRKKQ